MIFSRYFLVTELCVFGTHVENYFIFKVKETNVCWPQQNNSSIVLSRNPDVIENYSKTIQLIKSRNCDVIGAYSLRSKRFCAVREQRITGRWMEWVKEGEGKGEGREEGNACRQTPGFWKPPTRKQRCHAVINKPIKSSASRRGSELWTKTNFTVKTGQAFLSRVD